MITILTRDDVLALKKIFEEWADTQEQDSFPSLFIIQTMIDNTIRKYDKNDCWKTPESQKELGAMFRSIHKIIGRDDK